MKGCTVKGIGIDGEWLYIKKPFTDELDFWIQQYKIKEGHSEWSETFQKNIWIEDEDQKSQVLLIVQWGFPEWY